MSKLNTFFKLLRSNPSTLSAAFCDNARHLKISHLIPDKPYLKWIYRVHMHKDLDFHHPVSFNEKLQWLKVYDRKQEYIRMVDKLAVKDYISNKIGSMYVIPTLGVWETADNIDFESLPSKFVLKCNHDSRSVVVCKDKSQLRQSEVRKHLDKCLKTNLYWWGREWPYKNVKPMIFAETYLEEDGLQELNDYKLMCFDGKVKCSFVCSERFEENGLRVTFFDRDWKRMPFIRHYPASEKYIACPKTYKKMIELAEELSKGIKFVRVDFYEVKGQIYFGELTFFPGSGLEEFTPDKWDDILGSWIEL